MNYHVVLVDVDPKAELLANELNKVAGSECCRFMKANVVSIKEMQHVFKTAAEWNQGYIDVSRLTLSDSWIVINNAGIGEKVPFSIDEQDSWVNVVQVDLIGVLLGCRLAMHYMQKAQDRPGIIINTASLAGLYPQPFQPAYAAAKGGASITFRLIMLGSAFYTIIGKAMPRYLY
jgi:15-hydroxyprostaglandin dehydrogenase (NAD)